ncbi:MAG: sigma-70 family RNA polymerase sigma factor [Prevotellaceae bacterium]|nr:sigma-70 family RNA polymerase sigma factor [Prevotellaceae bacterium]MDY6131196.1 sigma-70 family RNA polymerase sigma factor [Prevotella sp.]
MKNTGIEMLFRRHYKKMCELASGILLDDAEAQDVVSDVFIHVMRGNIVLLPESAEGYLMRSVRNCALNVIRQKNFKQRAVGLLLNERMMDGSANEETLEQLIFVVDGIEPPLRRQILKMRFLREMSYQDIADALGVSKVTVYSHLSQAMDSIREQLRRARL